MPTTHLPQTREVLIRNVEQLTVLGLKNEVARTPLLPLDPEPTSYLAQLQICLAILTLDLKATPMYEQQANNKNTS